MAPSNRIALCALLVGFTAGCARAPSPEPSASATGPSARSAPAGDPVEGLRLATVVGCRGCHADNGAGKVLAEEKDVYRAVAPNLTERRALYDDVGMVALLRQGKTHDGHRPLGMPIRMSQHLSDAEVRDITAWLRSIPSVANPDLPQGWLSDSMKQLLVDGTFPYVDDIPEPAMSHWHPGRPSHSHLEGIS